MSDTPSKFRKKPVVIEAVQFDGTPGGAVAVFDQFDIPGAKFSPALEDLNRGVIVMPTLGGLANVKAGDWVCRQIVNRKPDYWPCNQEIFAATYEPVHIAGASDAIGSTGPGSITFPTGITVSSNTAFSSSGAPKPPIQNEIIERFSSGAPSKGNMSTEERITWLENQVAIAAAILAMRRALQSPMGGDAVREVLDEMRDVVPEMVESHG